MIWFYVGSLVPLKHLDIKAIFSADDQNIQNLLWFVQRKNRTMKENLYTKRSSDKHNS